MLSFDEASLRQAISDVLLRSAGLPTIKEALERLRDVKEKVEVIVAYRDEQWAHEAKNLLKPAIETGAAKARLLASKEWVVDRPQPMISIGGRLDYRFSFYGLPNDILQPVFLLAVAAAGGAWKSASCTGISDAKGKLVVYVVPGLPCVRALYYIIPILFCSPEAKAEAVNIETMILQGMRPPVDRVPAFVTPKGSLVKGAPRSTGDAARLWAS